jgi:hypothetical protein
MPSQPQNTVVKTVTFESPSHVQIIPCRVFAACFSLESVCIPTSVTKIDATAFIHCHSLAIIVFESPSTVTEFGSEAFAYCWSLQSINIPPSLLHIGDSCFASGHRLSEVVFDSPSQLTSIGHWVFENCPSLSFFYIPRRLQIIDGISFAASSIIDVEVDPDNQFFSMVDSYLINFVTHSIIRFFSDDSATVIWNSIRELGLDSFTRRNLLTTLTFESPSIVVKFLGYAFLDCASLKSICIPASVQFVGQGCFTSCKSLVSVTFEEPSALAIVDDAAFDDCRSLPHISIPASIQQIGSSCFVDCESLTAIIFESPSHLSILGNLGNLGLPSIDIPDSVEVIRGMTTSSTAGSLIVSFGSKSKLSAVYPRQYPKGGIGAFVRYSEATLKRFRATVDDFAQGAEA